MPTTLSCKSASALDSLPRNANARRSGTALHRLQQQKQDRKQQQKQGWEGEEFGSSPSGLQQHTAEAGPSRAVSNNKLLRRHSKKSSKASNNRAIASDDLPLASSDLYADTPSSPHHHYNSREAFSDGEQNVGRGRNSDDEDDEDLSSIRIVGGTGATAVPRQRALSLSPRKLHQPIMASIQDDEDVSPRDSPIARQTSTPSPTKRQQAFPARKRIVTKEMIGKPTNFQHTGHIGAGAYGAISSGAGDADKLKQQLSEVAAALRLDDSFSTGSTSTLTATAPSHNVSSKGSESSLVPASVVMHAEDHIPTYEVQVPSPPKETAKLDETPSQQTLPNESLEQAPTAVDQPVAASGAGGLKRTTSKRKPVPVPRKLADLYGEFASGEDQNDSSIADERENAFVAPSMTPTPIPTRIEEDEEVSSYDNESDKPVKPVPTVRASNGKRLVHGPAGEYITETANVRWNKALNEITLALKDDGADDDTEEHDIQQELQRADQVLQRLNAI